MRSVRSIGQRHAPGLLSESLALRVARSTPFLSHFPEAEYLPMLTELVKTKLSGVFPLPSLFLVSPLLPSRVPLASSHAPQGFIKHAPVSFPSRFRVFSKSFLAGLRSGLPVDTEVLRLPRRRRPRVCPKPCIRVERATGTARRPASENVTCGRMIMMSALPERRAAPTSQCRLNSRRRVARRRRQVLRRKPFVLDWSAAAVTAANHGGAGVAIDLKF